MTHAAISIWYLWGPGGSRSSASTPPFSSYVRSLSETRIYSIAAGWMASVAWTSFGPRAGSLSRVVLPRPTSVHGGL